MLVTDHLKVISHSPEETQSLGRRIGELAEAGDVVLLIGELGAGKTCLTQGIAWGLGITGYAISPTFVIMREMQGRLSLYHVDLYRLDDIAEIADLGLDDYLDGDGVTVIEWADKGLAVLPEEHLKVEIGHGPGDERCLTLTASSERYRRLLPELGKTAQTEAAG